MRSWPAITPGRPLVSVAPYAQEDRHSWRPTLWPGATGWSLPSAAHEEQTMITARFDNLGKGASGAAVQNMNLMLGL